MTTTFRAWLALVALLVGCLATAPVRAQPAGNDASARGVTPPRAVSRPAVPYPQGARGDADVLLELVVAKDGSVRSARVLEGDVPFGDTAAGAAMTWHFEPALRDGTAVSAKIHIAVSFRKEAEPAAATAPSTSTARASSAGPRASLPPASVETAVTVHGFRRPLANVLSRADVRVLPGALADPLRAIEALPGVTPTLSGAPYFYVRGAPPGNVGYFFDGVRLPALFHAVAGPSVIHPALIEYVEFHPGPYPASLGRAAGAVVAAFSEQSSGPARGEIAVRATDSSAFLQVPLGEGAAEVTLAGRYAYATPVLRLFAPELSVAYADYQARVRLFPTRRDTLSLFGFGAHDLLTEEREEGRKTVYGVTFHRLDARYERELERGRADAGVVLGWDRSSVRNGDATVRDVSVRLRGGLESRIGESARFYAGADAGRADYSAHVANVDDGLARADLTRRYARRSDTVAGAYVGLQQKLGGRIMLDPGLRVDAYFSRSDWAVGVEPRLIAEIEVSPRVTLVHGLGVAHQPPADPLPQPGIDPPLDGGLQTAVQSSAGMRWLLPADLHFQATLFQSMQLNLTDDPSRRLGQDAVPEDARALGSTRGVEFLLKRTLSMAWGGYVVYTLSQTWRSFGRAEGPSAFDRTHVLGGAFSRGFRNGYRVGVRGTFYSGIPSKVAYLEAARHPPRTPPFYRLDVRAEKRWAFAGGGYLALVAEVLNTTLNREVLDQSCNAYACERTYAAPVTIPNLGVEGGF
jgi:TonB family protein